MNETELLVVSAAQQGNGMDLRSTLVSLRKMGSSDLGTRHPGLVVRYLFYSLRLFFNNFTYSLSSCVIFAPYQKLFILLQL